MGDRRICRSVVLGGKFRPGSRPWSLIADVMCRCACGAGCRWRMSPKDVAEKKECKIKQRAEHNRYVCMLFGIYADTNF